MEIFLVARAGPCLAVYDVSMDLETVGIHTRTHARRYWFARRPTIYALVPNLSHRMCSVQLVPVTSSGRGAKSGAPGPTSGHIALPVGHSAPRMPGNSDDTPHLNLGLSDICSQRTINCRCSGVACTGSALAHYSWLRFQIPIPMYRALRSRCMRARGKGLLPGRVEGSSRVMLATARPSCFCNWRKPNNPIM